MRKVVLSSIKDIVNNEWAYSKLFINEVLCSRHNNECM